MVSIIGWHSPKSCHSGFDLDHQIELGGGRPTLALRLLPLDLLCMARAQAIAAPVVRIEMSACSISFAMDCLSAAMRRLTSAMVNPGSKEKRSGSRDRRLAVT